MSKVSIFIDSNIFVSYFNKDDVNHERSKKMIQDIIVHKKYGQSFSSDYVFSESVTVCLARTKSMNLAKKLGESLLSSEILLLKVTNIIFEKSWELFKKSRISFTDCTNVELVRTYGIEYLATLDKELKKIKDIKVID